MTEPSAVARFFGAALIAVGALMTLLSGGCTGYFVFVSIASLFSENRAFNFQLLLLSLAVGLPFIAIGVVFVVQGRRLFRGGR